MSNPQSSIPSDLPPLEHERFAAHRELEARLKKVLRGEVQFDLASRALYAADASNYRQLPVGVILPRDAADVEAALAECRALGAAVLARGAGTSLAGQCANVAVVFDYSRHMKTIEAIDPDAKLARVQPGVVLDRLREAAEVYHLTYGPDPATHSRCTLGGMIGNNSCGVHGLLAGKVVDNVESLDVVLYDGTRMTVGRTSSEQRQALIRAGGRVGAIYSGLTHLRDRYASLVREKYPRIPRRVSGYNLDELLDENGFNVARALVGSEGTCVNVLSASLILAASPPFRVLVVLAFADAFEAADAVMLTLEHGPIGLEGFDALLVNFMRKKGINLADMALLPQAGGFLLVEMGAWDAEEARAKAEKLAREAPSWPGTPSARIHTPEDAARIWHIRDSALAGNVFIPGEPNGLEGWEDAAVEPARLGDYLRALTRLMTEFGYRSPVWGHYGQGCAHLRINFDLKTAEGRQKYRAFIDRAADLAVSFGGSLSGEHGDGQSRAALLPKMFGPELVEAFRAFKAIWDPDNRMNPGKLSDAVRVYDPIENIRHPLEAPGHEPAAHEPKKHFAFSADHGSLELAAERCVGVGVCRNTKGGSMCPSYRATLDEKHSTRGRARLLWEMMAGSLRGEGFQSRGVDEALSLCLSCKACKSECPVQVDMARYKAEFLAQRYKGRLHPLHHYIFGFADRLARWGSIAPGVTNALLTGPLTSPLAKRVAGVAPERKLPRLARQSYQRQRAGVSGAANGGGLDAVVLWPDTWNNYYHPDTLLAADRVLTEAGFQIEVPSGHICCGRPLYDFGFLDAARNYLGRVLDRMAPRIAAGRPFIFLEPSCASVFKDELLELFPNDPRARQLNSQTWLLADWLAAKAPNAFAGRLEGAHVLVHGHCHQKAILGGTATEIAVLQQAGARVEPIQAGCCGMAGPFGFEAEKYAVSKAIAADGFLPAVESAGPLTMVVADGFSCREQISQLAHREAMHFAEVLAHGCGCGG